MADLAEIVTFLDKELRIAEIPDYPGAVNGLQLANGGKIERIVAAVDASLPVIEAAAAGGPGLLVVHHGMFWQGVQPVTGAFYRKLKIAMEAGLAIYSSHLPLDVHPEWGNNIQLARGLGLTEIQPFFEQKGVFLGLRGNLGRHTGRPNRNAPQRPWRRGSSLSGWSGSRRSRGRYYRRRRK